MQRSETASAIALFTLDLYYYYFNFEQSILFYTVYDKASLSMKTLATFSHQNSVQYLQVLADLVTGAWTNDSETN